MRIRSHGCEGHRRLLRTRGGPGVCCQRRAASRAGGRGRHPAGLGQLLTCQGRTRVLAPNPPNHATNKTQRRCGAAAARPRQWISPSSPQMRRTRGAPPVLRAEGAVPSVRGPRPRPPAAASRSEHREAGAAGFRQLPTPRNPGGRGPGRASPVTDTGAHLGPSALSLLSRRTAARLPRRASVSPRSGGRKPRSGAGASAVGSWGALPRSGRRSSPRLQVAEGARALWGGPSQKDTDLVPGLRPEDRVVPDPPLRVSG